MAKELLARRRRRRRGVCLLSLPVIYFLSLYFLSLSFWEHGNVAVQQRPPFQDNNSSLDRPRQLKQQQKQPIHDHRLRSVDAASATTSVGKPTKVSTTTTTATATSSTAPKTSHATPAETTTTVHNGTDGALNDSASAGTENEDDNSGSSKQTRVLPVLNNASSSEEEPNNGPQPTPHEEYMKRRAYSDSWFDGPRSLRPNADVDGPILDFAVVGFPKCGTTTMMANLGHLAPMPVADVCTPMAETVWYSYHGWSEEFGGGANNKTMRGTKCPSLIDDDVHVGLDTLSGSLPKTKLIVGIRHPLKWFESFWNMQAWRKDAEPSPYNRTTLCTNKHHCRGSCPHGQLFCLHRARFHLGLAALGKTELSKEERMLLAPGDPDGGDSIKNKGVRNPVFLYEQEELSQDYLWEELAGFLGVGNIPHEKYHGSHGRKNKIHGVDFCSDEHDAFRAMIMPYAHELAVWMQEYFLPVARDESRADVVVPRPDRMAELVEAYKADPCGKLVRYDDGTYALPRHNPTPAGNGEILVS